MWPNICTVRRAFFRAGPQATGSQAKHKIAALQNRVPGSDSIPKTAAADGSIILSRVGSLNSAGQLLVGSNYPRNAHALLVLAHRTSRETQRRPRAPKPRAESHGDGGDSQPEPGLLLFFKADCPALLNSQSIASN